MPRRKTNAKRHRSGKAKAVAKERTGKRVAKTDASATKNTRRLRSLVQRFRSFSKRGFELRVKRMGKTASSATKNTHK